MLFNREPVLVLGLVATLLDLAVGFGLNVSPEQVALINAAVVAAVSFAARTQVTPVKGEVK